MSYYVEFRASEGVLEAHDFPRRLKSMTLGPFEGFVQLTYTDLRFGPDGDSVAYYDRTDDVWVMRDDEETGWSDVVIYEKED